MGTVFHVCNPYCGKCKPPREPLLICSQCETTNDPEQGEFGFCKACGAQLPPRQVPEPIFCAIVDEMCARPCGRGKDPSISRTTSRRCIYHTPCT